MTALSTGGLGDIVYSIPIMRLLNVGRIYVKQTNYHPEYGSLYLSIKPLLESQGFNVCPYPDLPLFIYDESIHIDYDLDTFRYQKFRGINHIMLSLRNQFKLSHDNWKDPWLFITGDHHLQMPLAITKPYSIIHLTERWRGIRKVDWRKVLHSIDRKVYFVGFQHEWIDFCFNYGDVQWLPTDNMLDLARVIRDSESVYCNQSVSLALSQGMGKTYFLERKPNKTNTLLFTKNENLL